MFSTKGQEVKSDGGLGKSLPYGVVNAHIFSAQVITSKKGDKKALEFVLEGPALPNFEGWSIEYGDENGPKFKGRSLRVMATMYTDQFADPSATKNEIVYKLIVIATELGLRSEIDEIKANNIENWVEKVVTLIRDRDLYFFVKVNEEEYMGKTKLRHSLPKFKFASIVESKLEQFDKNNPYHYKALPKEELKEFSPANNDFDMD